MEEYLIEHILPSREVHLVGGPSGAGKSRWLFNTLLEWEKAEDILGFRSYPVPWAYVAADRSLRSVERTLATMGIDHGRIPTIPAFGKDRKGINGILEEIAKRKAQLAIIEAFGKFPESPGRPHQIESFLNFVSSVTDNSKEFPDGLTIIGVVESPKMKPSERYELPRQRVSGAASWGHYTETVILIEPANLKDPTDGKRTLTCCPRNAADIVLHGGFDENGHLCFKSTQKDTSLLSRLKSRGK